MKITYHVATSKDGFIAKEDGSVSWLDEMNIDMADTDLESFFASIDGIVMGSRTYDFLLSYGSWPYEDKPSWVCTSRQLQKLDGADLQFAETAEQAVHEAASLECQHLWLLGGGQLASTFIDQGYLSNISISEMPIDLGSGIPVFANHHLAELETIKRTEVRRKGFTQIDIELKREPNDQTAKLGKREAWHREGRSRG